MTMTKTCTSSSECEVRELLHEKTHPYPIVEDSQRGALSSDLERQDFGTVQPGDSIQAGAERYHVLKSISKRTGLDMQ